MKMRDLNTTGLFDDLFRSESGKAYEDDNDHVDYFSDSSFVVEADGIVFKCMMMAENDYVGVLLDNNFNTGNGTSDSLFSSLSKNTLEKCKNASVIFSCEGTFTEVVDHCLAKMSNFMLDCDDCMKKLKRSKKGGKKIIDKLAQAMLSGAPEK